MDLATANVVTAVQFCVRLPDGALRTLRMPIGTPVAAVRQLLRGEVLGSAAFSLLLGGKALPDTQTLREAGLLANDVIVAKLKLP